MINLEPKYSQYNECIENQVYTIVNGMGYTNEFAYIDSMFFGFDITTYTDAKWSKIGELIDITYDLYIENLSKFWNIEVQLMLCDYEDFTIELKKSLASGLPLIVFINSYWCPWERGLYKRHKGFNHAFIVRDFTNDGYCCTDGHRGIKDCFISKEDLFNGYLGKIIKIRWNRNISKQLSWKKMISHAVGNISQQNQLFCGNIRFLKNAIINRLDMKMELKGFESSFITVKQAPLIAAIRRIKNERKKFKWCVESIQTEYKLSHIEELKQIINLADNSAEHWKILSVLFIKYFYSSDIKHKEKIVDLIDEIIEIEQNINKIMIKVINTNV